MKLTKKFALISFEKSLLENYNPLIIKESEDIEELEAIEVNDTITQGFTIAEQVDGKIYDYYQGEKLNFSNY